MSNDPNQMPDPGRQEIPAVCDVVIVGAGIGGLTAAALLSRTGLKVCVLEKAARFGGYLAGFDREGFRFETAIHWLNQCHPKGLARAVFNFIGEDAPVTPTSMRIRRYKSDRSDYLLTACPDAMRDRLMADFPDEAPAIRRFFAAAESAGEAFPKIALMYRSLDTMPFYERVHRHLSAFWSVFPLIRYLPFSAERGFKKEFNSSALLEVFQASDRLISCLVPVGWAYTGDFQQLPQGGSRVFPEWLAGVAKRDGAVVACSAEVRQIAVDDKRVSRVSYMHKGERRDMATRYVIAACDVESLYSKMLPAGAVPLTFIEKRQKADVYQSSVTLSLGLDTTLDALGLNEEHIFLTRSDQPRDVQHGADPERSEVCVVPISFRDPTLAPPGQGAMTISMSCLISDQDHWKTQRDAEGRYVRGQAYRDFKRAFADQILKRVEEAIIPGLRRHIVLLDIATPITYQRYTGNRDGSVMGFRPSARNLRNRLGGARTPIDNLFIGGQWAEPGGGVPNAVKAAVNASLLIMQREAPASFRALGEVADGKTISSDFTG